MSLHASNAGRASGPSIRKEGAMGATHMLSTITAKDALGVAKFGALLLPSIGVRLANKLRGVRVWLVSEHETARDNGYVFFRYLRENHPEIRAYYAMDKADAGYEKVRPLGNVVQWASWKHYLLYMVSDWNVSSHKNGVPNHALFTFLQRVLGRYDKFVFLQHGITYLDNPMFYAKNCLFRMFVCGAKPEFDHISQRYGYRRSEVCFTGFPRFDLLHDAQKDDSMILFMPTWRRWITSEEDLLQSGYFKAVQAILNDKDLDDALGRTGRHMWFYVHAGFWRFSNLFGTSCENIAVLDPHTCDIQDLLRTGALLITDYSSVFFDFAYQHKPVIYYQFDLDEFQDRHIGSAESYFDYEEDGFGPVVRSREALVAAVEKQIECGFQMDERYRERTERFFPLHDKRNCERVYQEIVHMEHGA